MAPTDAVGQKMSGTPDRPSLKFLYRLESIGDIVAYLTAKDQERRQRELDSGLVSERFPGVTRIRLEVEFHNSSGKRVQRRCRDLASDSYAIFEMNCPLDDTPFDLKSEVSKMVSSRTKRLDSKVKCSGLHNDSRHEISYKIKIHVAKERSKRA